MGLDLDGFGWWAEESYEVQELEGCSRGGSTLHSGVQTYVTTARPLGSPGPPSAREYHLQREYPGLFRTFAALDTSPESILAFARRYGMLGVWDYVILPKHGGAKGTGEPLSRWIGEIEAMRECVELWEAIQANNLAFLQERIAAWQADYAAHNPSVAPLNNPVGRFIERWVPGDGSVRYQETDSPVVYALWHIADQVDLRAGDFWRVGVNFARNPDRLYAGIWPRHLLGALWMQLVVAIENRIAFAPCSRPGCTHFFAVKSPRAHERRFCSTACRVSVYQARKKEALRMRAQGIGAEEIAERLGSDVRTVVKWIGGER